MKRESVKQIIMFIAVVFCLCVSVSAAVYAESLAEEVEWDVYDTEYEDALTDAIDEDDYVTDEDEWTEDDEDYEFSDEDVSGRINDIEEKNQDELTDKEYDDAGKENLTESLAECISEVTEEDSTLSAAEEPLAAGDVVASGTCGSLVTWSLSGNGIMTISGSGAMTKVPWSDYWSQITEVIISEGVTTIKDNAFFSCEKLTSVSLSNSVTSIGMSAFENCSALKTFTIPDGVVSMGGWTFEGCSSLTTVTISNGLTSIPEAAFSYCKSLKTVVIPGRVTIIGEGAFEGCENLTSVTIPDSVITISKDAFRYCQSLAGLTIPDSVETISESAFSFCTSLTSITIPNNVGTISERAFYCCTKLVKVTLPDSLTELQAYVFDGCSSLKTITIPNSVETVGDMAFGGCSNLISIIIPDDTGIGSCAFYCCNGLKVIYFQGDYYNISEDAFKDTAATAYYPGNNATWTTEVRSNYGGTITWVSYGTQGVSLKDAEISGIADKTYTGAALSQKPVVKLRGATLVLDQDYYLAYKDNTNVGKATIAIKGKGIYGNVAVRYFNVKPASVKNADITGITSKVYTGSALTQTPVVKIGTKTLKLDTDYYLAYKNNINTGKATIAIKGKGNYNNVAVRYFDVNPKPSWIDKLTTPKTKQITIKWGKRTQISGYQLEISTMKDFSKPRMQKNVYDPAKLSMTVTVAKAKTTYYVRIRSFKKTKEKTYFSAWSATKTIKTK